MAFWASFLLLRLSGPDTITSFALEDNELRLRHLAGLILQVFATAYIFYQSLPNKLCVPTIIVFLVGTIKHVERTRALFLASRTSLDVQCCQSQTSSLNLKKS
ncbi:hypothetical protein SO802_026690 [Lithocarpus litseifolius]|uniref:DUF4220 domain-containing protein n=1 Tax=Lithocarpus litseifolius TaxID=425828 RepID=A0AAW2C3Q1_9ROSI